MGVISIYEDPKKAQNLVDHLIYIISTGLIKRFVFPSSYIVYGKAEGYPIKETAPLNPNTLYGANKTICEALTPG